MAKAIMRVVCLSAITTLAYQGITEAPEGESCTSTVLGSSGRLNFEDDVHPQDRLMLPAGQ